jgi:hypothetical protein
MPSALIEFVRVLMSGATKSWRTTALGVLAALLLAGPQLLKLWPGAHGVVRALGLDPAAPVDLLLVATGVAVALGFTLARDEPKPPPK